MTSRRKARRRHSDGRNSAEIAVERWSISSASTIPAFGFSSAHTMPASTAEVTCRPVAFWWGLRKAAGREQQIVDKNIS
jgi:hypothetical protein